MHAEGIGCCFGRLASSGRTLVRSISKAGANPLPHIASPCTVAFALAHCVDVCSRPSKKLLQYLSRHCGSAADAHALARLASPEGHIEYAKRVVEERLSLLDVLQDHRSAAPPLDGLLEALPPLGARTYCIASAPQAHPDSLHVIVDVVRAPAGPRGRVPGVGSAWLERLALAASGAAGKAAGKQLPKGWEPFVPMCLRSAGHFRLPADPGVAVVMVGPGAGVAPFLAFLQARRHTAQARDSKSFMFYATLC